MNIARSLTRLAKSTAVVLPAALALSPLAGLAGESQVLFQKPSQAATAKPSTSGTTLKFTSPSSSAATQVAGAPLKQVQNPTAAAEAQSTPQPTFREAAKPLATARRNTATRPAVQQAPAKTTSRPAFTQPSGAGGQLAEYRTVGGAPRNRVVTIDQSEPWPVQPVQATRVGPEAYLDGYIDGGMSAFGTVPSSCDCGEPTCGILEPGCGIVEPGCGVLEPGCSMEAACGLVEPGCGVVEPGCGVYEPGCGVMEPSCGCGDFGCDGVDCGSCVRPTPDYWCFPVCLPRFKELSVWAGVHGFKGPRDAPAFGGAGDGNFGFQEGINLGGRAPFVGLLFPQLSYQLGYQAVQSQLSGNSGGSTEDRSQNFVTAGLFRRVPAGLQFGVVWDYQDDDFIADLDFQQIRYEISIKSQRGREIGFWGATHTNTELLGSTEFQAVDQYNLFFRCYLREGAEVRFWGGGTNDGEGIFGADAYAPINNRWSFFTGFNYLIPDEDAGVIGAQEESWNLFANVVWHFGRSAKTSRTNPHRPLFPTANNGYMFIDARP